MRCRTAGRLMSLQIDHALGPEELASLSQHLEQCERCRAAWVAMRRANDLLCEPSWQEPPPALTEQILARLPKDRRAVVPPVPVWTRASLMVLAATVVLLVGLTSVVALVAVAPGQGDWARIQRGGWVAIAAVRDQFLHLLSAFGHVVRALWQVFGWPWAPLLALLAASAVFLWVWLWRWNSRRSGLP